MNEDDGNSKVSSSRAPADTLAWIHGEAFPRILPFALFMVFVAANSFVPPPLPVAPGEFDSRWIYGARAVVAAAALLYFWSRFVELRTGPPLALRGWLLSLGIGVGVLVIWVLLDEGWVTFELSSGFDPRVFGSEAIHWPITALRLFGLALVVPVMEELFWRSFLMRWLEKPEFLGVLPARVGVRALLISSVLFALEHSQWLAGLIAGLAYGWLYMRTNNLWAPIVAHATTNALLGVYILVTQDWRFW